MKIAIDASDAYSDRAGISRLLEGIISGFQTEGNEHTIIIYSRTDLPIKAGGNFRLEVIPKVPRHLGGGVIWYRRLAKDLKEREVDVLINATLNISPLFFPKVLQIVNDLSPLDFPRSYSPLFVIRYWIFLKLAIRRSKWLVSISQHTRDRLIQSCRVKKEVYVIPLGIDGWVYQNPSKEEIKAVEEKYDLPKDFVFSVSTLQPRKNYLNMIRAFATVTASNPDLHYLIVGRKGWYYEEIFEEVKRLKLESRIHFLGFVPDSELIVLFEKAKALLYVSLDEGFGFPAVQGVVKNLPIVLSDIPVFRELKAVPNFIFTDPNSVESIAAAIRAGISSKPGAPNPEFIEYYSWENTVRNLVRIVSK